jgi:hypothetical protein
MDTNHMSIEPTGLTNGTYRLFSMYDKESIALTAQGLLDLADWIATHREQLQAEAQETKRATREFWQREQPYYPPNGSWRDKE